MIFTYLELILLGLTIINMIILSCCLYWISRDKTGIIAYYEKEIATICANREPQDSDKGLVWIHETAAKKDIVSVYVKMYGIWHKFEKMR